MPQVPAKRYDLFIKAFEKEVAKAQEKIAQMDALMAPYEVCRKALEAANLINETELSLLSDGITIRIVPLDDDREGFCNKILDQIGKELKRLDLHPTGEPFTGNSSYDFYFSWRLRGNFKRPPTVTLRLDIPLTGTTYIEIVETNRQISTFQTVERRPVWLTEPKANRETNLGD